MDFIEYHPLSHREKSVIYRKFAKVYRIFVGQAQVNR
jgi:hypothetical protein